LEEHEVAMPKRKSTSPSKDQAVEEIAGLVDAFCGDDSEFVAKKARPQRELTLKQGAQ